MRKYKEYFNAACEQRYKLSRYRRELTVVEELRTAEEKKRVEVAKESHTFKKTNVKGFKDREEEKEKIRKLAGMNGSNERKSYPSVFQDL